ncbi:MAG: hypothetical protein JJE50_13145, partial [Actinomycetales bacterium]|nr:hypothetical protein [Actinomycetales bacterium]
MREILGVVESAEVPTRVRRAGCEPTTIAWPRSPGHLHGAFIWIGDSWWQMLTAATFAVVPTQFAFLGHD